MNTRARILALARRSLVACAAVGLAALTAGAQARHSGAGRSDRPAFEDYAVMKRFTVRPAAVSLEGQHLLLRLARPVPLALE